MVADASLRRSTAAGSGAASFNCLGEIVSQRVSPVSASSPCAAPIAPILLGLSLYGRRGRVLDLEPVGRAAGAVRRPSRLDTMPSQPSAHACL